MQAFNLFVLAIVARSTLALDEAACNAELNACFDDNYNKMMVFLNKSISTNARGFNTNLKDACQVYARGLNCLESVDCDKNADGIRPTYEKLTKNLADSVEGGCLKDGNVNPCSRILLDCTIKYQEARDFLKKHDVEHACTEAIEYDKCVASANEFEECPTGAILEMVKDEKDLTQEARSDGCDSGCIKLLDACTFELGRAPGDDKDEYCKAYGDTKTCLETSRADASCKQEESQKYLAAAVKQRQSKLTEKDCDGATSVIVSTVLLVSAVVASFLGRQV